MADRRMTKGARRLAAWLEAQGVTNERGGFSAWCAAHGLERATVARLLRGERWRQVPVDTAFAVEKATDGAVKASWFLSATAVAA